MTELYLIAHKVRGEPAFDIAIQMPCPLCTDPPHEDCTECEDLHYWWIIPTSGHRAYPYWSAPLSSIGICNSDYWEDSQTLGDAVPEMPANLDDHYTVSAAPKGRGLVSASELGKLLNLGRYAKPEGPPLRRPT